MTINNDIRVRALASAMLAVLTEQDSRYGPMTIENPVRPVPAKRQAAAKLARQSDNRKRTAKALGVSRSTIYRWMKEAESS